MSKKLDLKTVLGAIDRKNYDFYDDLPADEKKEVSPFVLMRFISNVKGDREIQEWFIEMTNEAVNKNHWSLSKDHKALLWKLLATTGIGSPLYHQYTAGGKKEKTHKIEKLLAELNPSMKISDIALWAKMMTEADKKELFDKMGFDKKQRKDYE